MKWFGRKIGECGVEEEGGKINEAYDRCRTAFVKIWTYLGKIALIKSSKVHLVHHYVR